jgi:hypothetical protein
MWAIKSINLILLRNIFLIPKKKVLKAPHPNLLPEGEGTLRNNPSSHKGRD